jgi:hypothetical protein
MVVDWYRKNLGTPFEVSPMPWLYQKYIGHDNNRDGYMLNMPESKVVTAVTLDFNPVVFYNHHQTAPFPARIWIPPFAEPVSKNTHHLMWRWINLFGTNMAAYLDERGMPGAIHRVGFDDWYPGFIDHVNNFRNTVSFLTETALYRYATPHFYTVNDFPKNRQDLRPEMFYSSPWKGGWWRLGDAVRYMIGASMSVLDMSAKYRKNLLYNRYQAARDVIRRFSEEPPYAYVIPFRQRDPQTAALLAERLRLNGIEIHRATQPFKANGRQYPEESHVILMNQPFSALVKELFEIQEYPDLKLFEDGPPDLPYDVAGWTLPIQMDVEVNAIMTKPGEDLLSNLELLETVSPPEGTVSGQGSVSAFSHQSNWSARAVNKALANGGKVTFSREKLELTGGVESRAVILEGLDSSAVEALAEEHGLQVKRLASAPAETVPVRAPRVGTLRPWRASIDEGWTRWILEDYGFDPVSIRNADILSGHLRERFDVIVLSDLRTQAIMEGYRQGTVPPAYAGGIENQGVGNLIQFVREGGTLVTFNQSSLFAIDKFNLPVENVLDGVKNTEFFCSGSLLKVELKKPDHPITMGMPVEPAVMFHRGPAFKPKPGFKGTILASYPGKTNPLLSGFILKPEKIQGKAALMEVFFGKGRVLLFGFRPQWRGQSHGTYKLIFNSMYYGTQPREEAADSGGDQTVSTWNTIQSGISSDIEKLVEAAKTLSSSKGSTAAGAEKKLSGLISSFQEIRLSALEEFTGSLSSSTAKEKLGEYGSQLRSMLANIRNNDLSQIDYSAQDLRRHYRLISLEKDIGSQLRP